MSHVDDGMLHAYLDGALSALDAVRVERHVADCAACQQRLDAARALVQRAARLLEWASPPADRAAPPLAALRPYAVPRWRVPVAWAATIVLALGAGVYGGQIVLRDKAEGKKEQLSSRDAQRADDERNRRADRELDRRAAPITVVADSPVLPVAPPIVNEAQAPAAYATGAGAPAAGLRESVKATPQMADAVAKTRVDSAAILAARTRQEAAPPKVTSAPAAIPAPAPAAAAAPAPAAATPRDSIAVAGTVPGAADRRAAGISSSLVPGAGKSAAESKVVAPVITIDSARVLLGTSPVSLPGYPVTAIRAADGAVTVEQVIPPGRVLRLVQRKALGAEEQVLGTQPLARSVEGLWVEISGPMAADSLSKLLERARGMP